MRAADVDDAARAVLSRAGFEKGFKHGLGHGVGFVAINHNAVPRLHPASDDLLEPGMIFNIEPAVYFEIYGGIRHCDVVLLTEKGPEVLTSIAVDARESHSDINFMTNTIELFVLPLWFKAAAWGFVAGSALPIGAAIGKHRKRSGAQQPSEAEDGYV